MTTPLAEYLAGLRSAAAGTTPLPREILAPTSAKEEARLSDEPPLPADHASWLAEMEHADRLRQVEDPAAAVHYERVLRGLRLFSPAKKKPQHFTVTPGALLLELELALRALEIGNATGVRRSLENAVRGVRELFGPAPAPRRADDARRRRQGQGPISKVTSGRGERP